MKISILAVCFFSIAGLASLSATETKTYEDWVNICEYTEHNEDALRCKIKDAEGNKMSCWFCDCDDLAEAFNEAFGGSEE